mgnify:CR=1 FL=1
MDSAKLGLLTTLLLGIFIFIGALIALLIKRKEKVVDFSLGLAFGVLIMLGITHMLPETIETLGIKYIYLFIIFTAIGYLLLKLLDKFIPDHDDDHTTHEDDDKNLKHIGLVSSIALIIHNIVEGMAIYILATSDIKAAFITCIGIGLHNIPLGL